MPTSPSSSSRLWPAAGPFRLDDDEAYARWRDAKLARAPAGPGDLVVELARPLAPSPAERAELAARCLWANMAVFAGPIVADEAPARLKAFSAGFGLTRIDSNMLADEDGVSPVRVATEGPRGRYAPYTNRALSWHTDGYYNPLDRPVRGLVLYMVEDAAEGGESLLADHEMAYIALRERDPGWIEAMMRPDALIIPPNAEPGQPPRPAQAGPVFSVDPLDGHLRMRYSARARNIVWKDDPALAEAVATLNALLKGDGEGKGVAEWVFRHRLAPGQGLLSNNVLHNRTGFQDGPGHVRLLYRARFHDRVAA